MTIIIALLLQIGTLNGDSNMQRADQTDQVTTGVIDELIIGNIE